MLKPLKLAFVKLELTSVELLAVRIELTHLKDIFEQNARHFGLFLTLHYYALTFLPI